MNYATAGYFISGSLFLILVFLMLTHWRGRLQGGLLLLVGVSTVIWAMMSGLNGYRTEGLHRSTIIVEILRNIALYAFLFSLLKPLYITRQRHGFYRVFYSGVYGAASLLLIGAFYLNYGVNVGSYFLYIDYKLILAGSLGLSIVGLVLIEQLFRNTREESRWAIKYLFFGFGLIFGYDFFLYSDALLFNHVDNNIWAGRGYVVGLAVPMLALTAQRNPKWSLEVFVSKQLVFHTTTLIGIGSYLILMASAGYYIKVYGGNWGAVAQIVFLSLAVLFLFIAIFSGDIRSKAKVFINKHFFNYKYDYREVWINITRDLSTVNEKAGLYTTVINSIANLIESTGGMLWLRDDKQQHYQLCARTIFADIKDVEAVDGRFACFLSEKDWLIDLHELKRSPELYEGLELPAWFAQLPRAWLIIPLRHMDELYGYLILAESRALSVINWEDRDLLKTACMQAVSYLAFQEASQSLAKSEKFAVFNRLSAYVVHDLKNLIAQLELITRNAEKFKHNPDFVDDAFETVQHATQKMGGLLTQLKQGRFQDHVASLVSIKDAIEEVVRRHHVYLPHPQLQCSLKDVKISANYDRFVSIVGHIIKNAQEATKDDGFVKVTATVENNRVMIIVEDNGEGMDEQFIREQLFVPFITTKGNAGMGVGVYECREFIEALGGHIDVVSQPGQGSQFVLSVPVVLDMQTTTGGSA